MNRIVHPKTRVLALAEMVRPGENLDVRGVRGGGYFTAEVLSGSRVIARARDRNWRKAYKGLEIELSKIGIF